MKKLDLTGESKVSNLELELASDSIFDILKDFDSPKDAASAFALAHYKLIVAAFPPEFRSEAIAAIDSHIKILKEFVNEGW